MGGEGGKRSVVRRVFLAITLGLAVGSGMACRDAARDDFGDMIWSAGITGGGRVMFLIELQRTAERLMALRTTTYAALTLDDVTALVLGMARNLSPEDMAAQVAALRLRVSERGDARLNEFMADRVRTMLELRDYTGKLKLGGAKTMDEVVDRFQRGLDELVRKGAREGRREGHRDGRAMVLRRVVARRFGEEAAGQVSEVLEGLPGPDAIDRVTDALFECGTGEEFIERVRTA